MVRKWKTVRVFISSTFRDTHFERDALTRLVFPELRQWCEDRYLHVTEIDLRWGISQEESAMGKASQICLDEIDRSDFFLCIIGSRYGWVPSDYGVGDEERFEWVRRQKGISITELEIMRGCLNTENERAPNISHAMFYFRDDSFLKDLESRPKELVQFTDGEVVFKSGQLQYVPDTKKEDQLRDLKERIRSHDRHMSVSIHENYKSLYTVDESLSGTNEEVLREFCLMVLEDLKAAIDARFPIAKLEQEMEVDPLRLEQDFHTSFMHYCLNSYEDRSDVVNKVVKYAQSDVVMGGLLVTAEPGMGKSTILSKACQMLEQKIASESKGSDGKPGLVSANSLMDAISSPSLAPKRGVKKKPIVLLPYFAGASPGSLQIHNMLRVLLQHLRKNLKKYKPKKRANQLWSIVRASVRVGNAMTLAGKLGNEMVNPSGKAGAPTAKKSAKRSLITSEIPSNFQDLVEDFKRTLVEACEYMRVILVLDNLDHLISDKNNAMTLRWLPHELPLSLRIIVGLDEHRQLLGSPKRLTKQTNDKSFRRPISPMSDSGVDYSQVHNKTRSGTVGHLKHPACSFPNVHQVGQYEARNFLESFQLHFKHLEQVSVPGLSKAQARKLVAARLWDYGKKLSPQQMEILLNKRSSDNPTWIVIACEELRVFPHYERVTERILELADDLPSLLEQMIKRLERDHGPRFVRDTLSILVCARDGLYEREIVGILGVPLSAWSQLFYSIKPVLSSMSRKGEQLISFQHRNFTLAILKRYFTEQQYPQQPIGSPVSPKSLDGGSSHNGLGHHQPRNLFDEICDKQLQQNSPYATPIHARLAIYFKEEARSSGRWNPEKRRALSSLSYHLLHGKLYRTLEATLTDLEFIESLMVSGSGFSWIDDLSACLATFEKAAALEQAQTGVPGLTIDTTLLKLSPAMTPKGIGSPTYGDSPDLLGSPQYGTVSNNIGSSFSPRQSLEHSVTHDMVRRIRDYYAFAQAYTPELNTCPTLVFQYASNLPDTNAACIAAKKLWDRILQDGGGPVTDTTRPWLKWVNKPQVSGPCLMTLCGHTAAVLSCNMSRDEKRVVTASVDHNVRVWIAQTGESPLVLEGHRDAVTQAVFSPMSADVVLSCSRDGTCRVWVKGVCARVFNRHDGVPVLCCTISECGNYVASGDQSGRLLIWEIFSETESIHDFRNFHGSITMVRFSATNDYIFAAGIDRTVRGWSLVDGSQYMTKSGEAMCFSTEWASEEEKMHYCVRTSAMRLKFFDAKNVNKSLGQPSSIAVQGDYAENESSDELSYEDEDDMDRFDDFEEMDSPMLDHLMKESKMDGKNGEDIDMDRPVINQQDIARAVIQDSEAHMVVTCGISRLGHVATGRTDGNIRIFSTKSGKPLCRLHGHIGNINCLYYSISGERLVSAADDHTVKIWNPRRARLNINTPHKTTVKRCTFSQSNKSLSLLSISHEGQVSMWNAATGYRTSLNPRHETLVDAAFTNNGTHYVTVAQSVRIFSANANDKRGWSIPQANVGLWTLSPCGKIFICVETGGRDLFVWNIYSTPTKRIRVLENAHMKKITVCQFSKDGGLLYTAANDGKIKIWDVLKLSAEMYIPNTHEPREAGERKVTVQEGEEGKSSPSSAQQHVNEQPIRPLLIFQDSKDMGLASLIHSIHESPDGKSMIAISDSPDMKHWDLEAALENGNHHHVTTLHGHANRVTCGAWAPHGYQFASGAVNGTIRLWHRGNFTCSSLFRGHTSAVVDLQFLPDGRRLASISTDKSLTIWSATTGEQINSMLLGAPLTTLALSSTGQYLAVGDAKGDLRILQIMNPFIGQEKCDDDDKVTTKTAQGTAIANGSTSNQGGSKNAAAAAATTTTTTGSRSSNNNNNNSNNKSTVLQVSNKDVASGSQVSSEGSNFEQQEFPFVAPTKILHITVKGSKKWDQRCQIVCPYCSKTFVANGNAMELIRKIEYNTSMQGYSDLVLRDLKLLNRCVHCRQLVRLTPFKLDRSVPLNRLLWKERQTRKKLLKNTLTTAEQMTLRYTADMVCSNSFYDNSQKMAPFHARNPGKRLPSLSTSSKKTDDNNITAHDLLTKHMHALTLKQKQKTSKYRTFKSGSRHGKRKEEDVEEKRLKFMKDLKRRQLDAMKSNRSLSIPSAMTTRTPNWLSAFDKNDDVFRTQRTMDMLLEEHGCNEDFDTESKHGGGGLEDGSSIGGVTVGPDPSTSFYPGSPTSTIREDSIMSEDHHHQDNGSPHLDDDDKYSHVSNLGTARTLRQKQQMRAPMLSRMYSYGDMESSVHNPTFSLTSKSITDDAFLEVEGPYIRRCNTASGGRLRKQLGTPSEFKVLRSTTDLKLDENLYDIVHARPRTQLEKIRKTNPVSLRISPEIINFQTLCERSVYRFPVQLLNMQSSLLRFRAAVQVQSSISTDGYQQATSNEGQQDSCCSMTVIQAPETNPLVHGLASTIFVEVKTAKPGQVTGFLRISTNSGHLYSTPIVAIIASKADYASSLKRSRAMKDGTVTNKQVLTISTILESAE